MDAVNEFLRRKETHIADSPLFVMGNESADLDSMVAAVAYAFFESHANQSCSVPVINIPRNEFVFRAEAVWLFESLGIPHDRLTFVDELDLGQFCKEGSAKLFLVDHNKLCPRQTDLAPMVCGTVDHHVDEGLYSSTCTHRRVVRLCGSATTLVAEAFFESGACSSALTPALAKLLLAAILVDTVNLDPAHQKVTPDDEAAAEKLLTVIAGPDTKAQTEVRQTLFATLQKEKYNTARLTVDDSLRKDYKAYKFGSSPVGIASVLDSVDDLIAKDPENFFAICDAFCTQNKIVGLIIMCAYFVTEENFKRELVVMQPSNAEPDEARSLYQKLTASLDAQADLDLTPLVPKVWPATELNARCWSQGNIGMSRKKLSPVLEKCFQ